jgi:hypothetical protein
VRADPLCYLEEPLVKNCVNSWRTFAVGDEIKIISDAETLKDAVKRVRLIHSHGFSSQQHPAISIHLPLQNRSSKL